MAQRKDLFTCVGARVCSFFNIPIASSSHIEMLLLWCLFLCCWDQCYDFFWIPPPRFSLHFWFYCLFWVKSWKMWCKVMFCFKQLWILPEVVHFSYVRECVRACVCLPVLCSSWCVVVRVTLQYFSLWLSDPCPRSPIAFYPAHASAIYPFRHPHVGVQVHAEALKKKAKNKHQM